MFSIKHIFPSFIPEEGFKSSDNRVKAEKLLYSSTASCSHWVDIFNSVLHLRGMGFCGLGGHTEGNWTWTAPTKFAASVGSQ
jgi:hypothetical protein